ncbi:uncharacterized protein LOC127158133 isoform X2 [Labeo rohita]|uniref:uncharacterized protein LOC127158133 isoform X2 n=1 Tax=Labeo rohita TaxID=84645 RepID=UPI0021E2B305|nr:uncharacterized protein LOC127158133 isoform X2 [Labeo rohita]
MEGDSVTLHNDVKIDHNTKIRWFFNDTRIAQITGDLSFICTDVQCNNGTERFRDRLKLDHQNGSLTITNTRTTDSGLYTLEIYSDSDSEKTFNVTVYGVTASKRDELKKTVEEKSDSMTESVSDSGLSSGAVAGICVGAVLTVAAAVAGVIYYRKRPAGQNGTGTRTQHSNQMDVTYSSVHSAEIELAPAATEPSNNGNANSSETSG